MADKPKPDNPIEDQFVVCPIDKNVIILDENNKFLFAMSAKHIVEGLIEHEDLCNYMENFELDHINCLAPQIGPAYMQGR